MHSVKIEFRPLDWYSSSPTTIVLYNKMYMCKAGVQKHVRALAPRDQEICPCDRNCNVLSIIIICRRNEIFLT